MKHYQVRITPGARRDLNNIVQYLRRKESATVATKVRQGIMEAIDYLQTFPERHPIFHEASTEQVVFRRMRQWRYKIVFTVDNDELIVLVLKIYHGHQDLTAIIEDLKP